jgi:hypothetical protein
MEKKMSPLKKRILQAIQSFLESKKNFGRLQPKKPRERHVGPIHHGNYYP